MFYSKSILLTMLFSGLLACAQTSITAKHSTVPAVNATQLMEDTKTITTQFYPRDYKHLDNLNKTADYIKQRLKLYSSQISEQSFEVEGQTYRNIIARFGPAEGELVVIGAHYDACGETYGADDNASGVAGMLELARLLKENPPKYPVELVAYSLEEPPFFSTDNMGSAFHAAWLKQSGQKVKLMLALEMIGYFKDEAGSQDFPLDYMKKTYGDKGNFIAVIGHMMNKTITGQVKSLMMGATDLPVHSLNAPAFVPGIDYSDHRNYWNNGFNAVMITDTSFYRNPYYHDYRGDKWSDLDYERMAKVVQGVYAVLQNL